MECSEFCAFFWAFSQSPTIPPTEDRGLWLRDCRSFSHRRLTKQLPFRPLAVTPQRITIEETLYFDFIGAFRTSNYDKIK